MLNKININIKWTYMLGFILLVIFFFIGLVEKKHGHKTINQLVINIDQQYDNFFIDRATVHQLITDGNAVNIMDIMMDEIDLKNIEQRIKTNRFVRHVDVYKDLKGSLIVNIEQRRPIARIIQSTEPDVYISEDGVILPTSQKFTARVVLISGDYVGKLAHKESITENDFKLLDLLQFIDDDPFWRAQIAQLAISKSGELIMYPQIGKQVIEFGQPDDYKEKFRNLKIFFTKVLPQKGWNHYKKVNIKYNNQIVCE